MEEEELKKNKKISIETVSHASNMEIDVQTNQEFTYPLTCWNQNQTQRKSYFLLFLNIILTCICCIPL